MGRVEAKALSLDVKKSFVAYATTRVGILLGVTAGLVAWSALGWGWYLAVPIAIVNMLFVGTVLKVVFRVTTIEA